MTAAILERHGLRTGAYLSPRLVSHRECVRVGGRELDAASFAGAIARAARAAERVARTLAEGERVTQFETLTAAAFSELARAQVQVGVVEAGLGGREDATSVIEAPVTVLTNVGLEHTRWLGPTVTAIAEAKLAVVREGGTLVIGEDLAPVAERVARRICAERGARIVQVASEPPSTPLLARGPFQRRNFALARAAAEAHLRAVGMGVSERAVARAAAETELPGRLQLVEQDPPTVLDGAHNTDAARALAQALPDVLPERPLALVLGVLDDKDAAGMLAELRGRCAHAWFTAPPNARARAPEELRRLALSLGFPHAACEPRPTVALARAREWASAHEGCVLATGSVYLVGELLAAREPHAGREAGAGRACVAGAFAGAAK
jgi:dihydrofolate synthase/folylpolyglutamate synthase